MFQSFQKSAGDREAIARIKSWTKSRFELPARTIIIVADINCQVPGCPPMETVIAFWDDDQTRYRIKIFKPVAEVQEADLPLKWLLPTLIDEDDLGCDCC